MKSHKKTSAAAVKKTLRTYNSIIIRGWRYTLPVGLAVSIGSLLVFYVPPLAIAALISQTGPVTLASAWPLVAAFGFAWLAGEMLWRLAFHLLAAFEAKTIRHLYKSALDSLVEKELAFFANRFTGTITKNLLSYAHRFVMFLDTITFEVVSNVIPVIFAAVVLAFISPWLSLALIGALVITGFIIVPLIRHRLGLIQSREEAHAAMAGHVSDVVTNIAAIKAFGSETSERGAHAAYVDDYVNKAKRSWDYQTLKIDMKISPIYVATNVIGLVIILSLSIDAASKAALFIGFNYYATITRFLWSFNSVYRRLEESVTEASQFVEYLMEPAKVIDAPGAKNLSVADGTIEFRAVGFSHADNRDALFDGFDLTIKPGQKVGLVGHSGAGKSTVVNLLLRFMDVDAGGVFVDGSDISTVTQQSLHQSIAFVPQEPLLFHRSLRDNIAYGKPDASDEEVREAAKKAHALEFIDKLPDGFATLVGERGIKLSGGQRQRVAIARAILKEAPVLVLDEATSALDSESEKLIQQSLGTLMKNRTSIVIAHRLSTIAKLDRIVVLDNGKIIEDGSHAELLARNGTYARLWSHQSGGFIEE